MNAKSIRELVRGGSATIVTTDDWHYSANEPVVEGDHVVFTVGAGEVQPVVRLPLDRVANIMPARAR